MYAIRSYYDYYPEDSSTAISTIDVSRHLILYCHSCLADLSIEKLRIPFIFKPCFTLSIKPLVFGLEERINVLLTHIVNSPPET